MNATAPCVDAVLFRASVLQLLFYAFARKLDINLVDNKRGRNGMTVLTRIRFEQAKAKASAASMEAVSGIFLCFSVAATWVVTASRSCAHRRAFICL